MTTQLNQQAGPEGQDGPTGRPGNPALVGRDGQHPVADTDPPGNDVIRPTSTGGTAERRRRRGVGSIQSKLLLMLLLSSILSAAVVGFFGYRSGTEALRDASFARLTDLRDQRTTALSD